MLAGRACGFDSPASKLQLKRIHGLKHSRVSRCNNSIKVKKSSQIYRDEQPLRI